MSWDTLHTHYKMQDWSKMPSIFAEQAVVYFPKIGKILEIGAGIGQDSRYFHSLRYEVDSTDFSSTATQMNISESLKEITLGKYKVFQADVSKDLESLGNDQYDCIYAHLSLHYFSKDQTIYILGELARILKKGGIIAVLLNSKSDPEYGSGLQIEEDYFEIVGKTIKRYFSVESASDIFGKFFPTIACDNHGETYKDKEKGIHNLIRYIGQKI